MTQQTFIVDYGLTIVNGNSIESDTGNVAITSTGSNTWTFGNTGTLTLPGEGVLQSLNDTVTLSSLNTTTGNANSVYLGSSGGLGFSDQAIGGNWLEIFRSGIDPQLATTGNLLITTDSTGAAPYWVFQKNGNTTVPKNIYGTNGAPLIIDGAASLEGYISLPHAQFGGEQVALVNQFSLGNGIALTTNGGSWHFDNTGNLTVPGNIVMPPSSTLTGTGASPAPSIDGFGTISSETVQAVSISVEGGRINGGLSTVVTDGINSIAQAPGATMDVYGFPFTGGGVRGQLTITDVTTPSQANGTWYYQSLNTYTYQIYTNSTYSTLVDASGWSAYTGAGNVAITQQDPASNVVINSNGYFSTFDNTGNLTVPGSVKFTSGSALTFGDTPVTNRYYIDATRTDTYTENGSQARPFKTIAAAQAAIATAIGNGLNPEVEPVYMILLSNITENVTLETNHVYLVGQNGQIHQPIILSGNVTVQPTSGTLNNNHFSISGMEIVGGTNGKAIYVTGTYPTRLSLQDVWITANGTGAGLYQDNTGTGTYTHGGPLKVSHNGSGDVYCFDIRKGTASFDSVETSGATQVGAAGSGATLTFNNSQLDANGDVVVETYGSGVLVVTNSVIKNSAANSYGIKLNAVANVAGTVSVGQSAFNVPAGTGQAVWLDPNTTPGLSGVFAWSGASFYPSTNTTISPTIIPGPLAILVGTQVSPIFYGDITSYAVAQDWDLIDNNASALSFDTTGKAGVLELVTTNSAEGVKMSGYANVVGNITGGNITTAGNISGNTAGYAIGYRDIPQVSFTGNATIATTDAGKHFYSTQSTDYILTIANNASQGFQVGSAITVVNQGTGNITIAQGSGVTLYMAGNATSGNRSVATFGMATIMKVATNTWFVSGVGVA